MNAFEAIILFLLISVIADRLEGRKKKKLPKNPPAPSEKKKPSSSAKVSIELDIPPIFGRRPEKKKKKPPAQPKPADAVPNPAQTPKIEPVIADAASVPVPEKPAESTAAKPAAASLEPPAVTAHRLPDLHSQAMLSAMLYTQILEPPRARRYMAMRRRPR